MARIFHVKRIELGEIMPLIVDKKFAKKRKEYKIEIHGFNVYVESLRLFTFKEKGCSCVSCGREGTHFRIQENGREVHLALWSDDNVEMTKDHIIPRSVGGLDHIDNMQTMCSKCNNKKGSLFSKKDFENGKGTFSYEEALIIKQEKKLRGSAGYKETISPEQRHLFNIQLAKKFPRIDEVMLRLREFRQREHRDPFNDLKGSEDVLYALKYLEEVMRLFKGEISNKSKKVSGFPKKLYKAERSKYVVSC